MNAKNLMIGDWVCVTSVCGWECEPIQQQIRGIEYSSFKGDDYCDWVSVDCDDEASLSHIEPITLTAEILENNGFKLIQETCVTKIINLFRFNKLINQKNKFFYLYQGEKEFYYLQSVNIEVNINYVHELQHALRLCGLNELADNFKIKGGEE